MTKEKAVSEKPLEERSPMFDLARKVLLAGVGAAALAQDETENFVKKLVERGGVAEQDGKKLMREVLEKRKSGTRRAGAEFDKRFEDLLARLDVPRKSDIDALSAKIAALSKKVDELKKSGE
jgi:poly(hydroxyalkanoate) granule-associated protein